jgi:hypothetical protein
MYLVIGQSKGPLHQKKINCGAQSTNVFIVFFFKLQWTISLTYHQKHYEIPPYRIKITFFTLFYMAM